MSSRLALPAMPAADCARNSRRLKLLSAAFIPVLRCQTELRNLADQLPRSILADINQAALLRALVNLSHAPANEAIFTGLERHRDDPAVHPGE
jgi:hypothetical protein